MINVEDRKLRWVPWVHHKPANSAKLDVKLSLDDIADPQHPEAADTFNRSVRENFSNQIAEIQPSGYLEASSQKTYDKAGLVAVELSSSSYAGGAHPDSKLETMLYDANEGKQIGLPDLFADKQEFLTALSHQVQGQLSRQGVEESQIASFTRPSLENFAAFTPNENGIQFLFPAERVGPYNAGLFEANLGWQTLKPLLDPHGPLQPPT